MAESEGGMDEERKLLVSELIETPRAVGNGRDRHRGKRRAKNQIPPDFVVKYQDIDIIDVIR